MPEEKKTYLVDGSTVDVNVADVNDFLKNVPNAIEAKSFIVGNDTVDVALTDVNDFLKNVKDAKPLYPNDNMGKPLAEPSSSSVVQSPSNGGVEFGFNQTISAEEPLVPQEETVPKPSEFAPKPQVIAPFQGLKESAESLPKKEKVGEERYPEMIASLRNDQSQVLPQYNELESLVTQQAAELEKNKAEVEAQLQDPNIPDELKNQLRSEFDAQFENHKQAVDQLQQLEQKRNQNQKAINILNAGYKRKGGQYEKEMEIIFDKQPFLDKATGVYNEFSAGVYNSVVPAVVSTVGALLKSPMLNPLAGTPANIVNEMAGDELLKLSDKLVIDADKLNAASGVMSTKIKSSQRLYDDINPYNFAQGMGNVVGSIGMTMLGGGAGKIGMQAAAFAQVYGNSYKDGIKAGLNNNQATMYASAIAAPSAILEEFGVSKLFDLAVSKGGKKILQEAILVELKKNAGKMTAKEIFDFTNKKVIQIVSSAGVESLVGITQTTAEFGTKLGTEAMTDADFEGNLTVDEFKKDVYDEFVLGSAGGGTAAVGIQTSPETINQVAAEALTSPEKMQDFKNNLESLRINGDITPEGFNTANTALNNAINVSKTVPATITNVDERKTAIDLIQKRDELAAQLENTDPDLAAPIQEELKTVKAELQDLAKGIKPKAEESATQKTTEEAQAPQATEQGIPVADIETKRKETEAKIKRKDLFRDGGVFANQLGESGVDSVPTNHSEINGIEFVEFSNPNTGVVDVIMTGKSDTDFVGYYRIYENGKPTNKWSSKFENQSRNKEDFKTMISGVQQMLPKGHEYTEKTSISTDGLRVWNQQLDRGYELQYDNKGNLITNKVAINGDAINNELGIPVNKGSFDNVSVTNSADMKKVKEALLPYLKKFGLNESNIYFENGTVKIDLPVLKNTSQQQTKTTENAIQEPSATQEVSRPGEAGQNIPEGGQGVRPSEQGQETAEQGKEEVKAEENAIVKLQKETPQVQDVELNTIEENLNIGDTVYGTIGGKEVSGKVYDVGVYKNQIVVDIVDQNGDKRFLYSRDIERIKPKEKEVEILNEQQKKRQLELINQEALSAEELDELGVLNDIRDGKIPNPANQLQQENLTSKETQNETTRKQPVAGNRLFNKPIEAAKNIADRYFKAAFGTKRPNFEGTRKLDKERAKRIATAYQNMKNDPNNPKVKAAYEAMVKETIAQYEEIIKDGYFIEVNNKEAYANSEEMIEDLRNNKRMKIFSTESGYGDSPITKKQRRENPLLRDSGFKDKNGVPLLNNDIFRAVHDFFGHAELGNSFGALGEENAWNVHSRMYSPLARQAVTSETRGQNSFVNFSNVNAEAQKLLDEAAKLRSEGKFKEALDITENIYEQLKFAEQKIGLLPEEFNNYDEENLTPNITTNESKNENGVQENGTKNGNENVSENEDGKQGNAKNEKEVTQPRLSDFGLTYKNVNDKFNEVSKIMPYRALETALENLGVERSDLDSAKEAFLAEFISKDLPSKLPNKKDKFDKDDLPKGEVVVKPIIKKITPSNPSNTKTKIDSLKNIVGNDDLRPVMNGVFQDAENGMLAATDAFKLITVSDATITESKIVDPKTGQTIQGRFPNYLAIIPQNNPIQVDVNVQDLINQTAGISRASDFFVGKNEFAIAVRIKIGDNNFYFNPKLLNDVLTVFANYGAKDVTFKLSTPTRAMVIEYGGVTGLLMPVMGENNQGNVLPHVTIVNRELTNKEKADGIKADLEYLSKKLEDKKKKLSDAKNNVRNASSNKDLNSANFDVKYEEKAVAEAQLEYDNKKAELDNLDNPLQEQFDLETVKTAIENGEITEQEATEFIESTIENTTEVESVIATIESKAESENEVELNEVIQNADNLISSQEGTQVGTDAFADLANQFGEAAKEAVKPETPTAQTFADISQNGKAGRDARESARKKFGKDAVAKMEEISRNFDKLIEQLESENKVRKECP